MSKKVSFFLTSIHHLLLRPRSFRSSLVLFDRDRSFLPFPVKNKIENTRRGFRGIPTIPNDDESFVPSSHVYTLDPPSKFRIIRFTPCSLSLSIFLPPISGTPLRPFQSASTIGPRRKTFIFFRGQTYISFHFQRTIFAMILITRHGLDLNLKYRAPHLSKKPGIASKRRETKYSYELYFVFLFRDKELVLLIK